MGGCGCGGRAAPTPPTTSGDFAVQATPGAPRFKVIRNELDPDTNQPKVDFYATHREARLAQVEGGGKLRLVT